MRVTSIVVHKSQLLAFSKGRGLTTRALTPICFSNSLAMVCFPTPGQLDEAFYNFPHTYVRYVERYQCLVLDLAGGIYVPLVEELSHCFGEEGGRLG